MSSADCDGDACTVIDNKIIQDGVVIPLGHEKMISHFFTRPFCISKKQLG